MILRYKLEGEATTCEKFDSIRRLQIPLRINHFIFLRWLRRSNLIRSFYWKMERTHLYSHRQRALHASVSFSIMQSAGYSKETDWNETSSHFSKWPCDVRRLRFNYRTRTKPAERLCLLRDRGKLMKVGFDLASISKQVLSTLPRQRHFSFLYWISYSNSLNASCVDRAIILPRF